jgi:hypothetical protein
MKFLQLSTSPVQRPTSSSGSPWAGSERWAVSTDGPSSVVPPPHSVWACHVGRDQLACGYRRGRHDPECGDGDVTREPYTGVGGSGVLAPHSVAWGGRNDPSQP